MKIKNDRWPHVGDLLIVYPQCRRNDTHPSRKECYVGVISKITENESDAHVAWQDTIPDHYNRQYGYAAMNVHNDRRMFRLFRGGQEMK